MQWTLIINICLHNLQQKSTLGFAFLLHNKKSVLQVIPREFKLGHVYRNKSAIRQCLIELFYEFKREKTSGNQ